MSRTLLNEWNALQSHALDMQETSISRLFDKNPERFDKFHVAHNGLLLDYSKTRASEETMHKLLDLARACDLEIWRDNMFKGVHINNTEDRPVLHTALRMPESEELMADGINIIPQIHDVLARIKILSDDIRKNKKYTHIVNLGIGGSDLGPKMVCEALKTFSDREIKLYFVSNVDSSDLAETLRKIEPEKTLFLITSKSFTTQETMANAHSARKWLREKLEYEDVSEHFIAVSANTDEAQNFGIAPDKIYPMWDWVGGRYSLWSAVGLPISIALGFENFRKLLDGAHDMDMHFLQAPLEKNMPILFGLIGIWHRNFQNHNAVTIAAYDESLKALTSYLQQLDMESNGKQVDRQGNPLDYDSGPIIFGKPGTNGQHAYFQSIHQGTSIIPCEFIAALNSQQPMGNHHDLLLSNMIGQAKALMDGKEDDDPHKMFTGNRPSVTILTDELDPYHLGMLLALYEHKIFVQGIIWNINSFDQWGVQLGKVLAKHVLDNMESETPDTQNLDSSTISLINCVKKSSVS